MPYKFQQLNPSSNLSAVINQINRNFGLLDLETVTKKFGDGDNVTIIGKIGDKAGIQFGTLSAAGIFQGQYAPGRFGALYYQDGVPLMLDGMAPDDGRIGHWKVPVGKNVLTELGG